MNKKIQTTVIGSYPIKTNNIELMNNYFNQQNTNWNHYINNAVNDMLKADIDIISDGQTRDPFIQIFTRKIKGCRIRNRTEIIDKIEYTQPITIQDQKYVKKLLPKNKQLIGLLTGPYTLTKSCVDLYYHDEQKLAFDFAKILQQEAKQLQKHVNIISIDEPFFSNKIPEYSKELISTIIKNIKIPTRLHVCGDVSHIIPEIIEIPVDILGILARRRGCRQRGRQVFRIMRGGGDVVEIGFPAQDHRLSMQVGLDPDGRVDRDDPV